MPAARRPHVSAVLREGERVMPLELFFDLVFVLALTQCTALMAHRPSWTALAQAILILGLLWWSWVGYAWLTSVINPEEGAVRLVIFAAMAAFLVVSLCIPHAFDNLAVLFAGAYAVVRYAQIALFWISAEGDDALRRSVSGLAVGTTVGVGLLTIGSIVGDHAQAPLWAAALVLDMAGPYFFGSEGWKLRPGHFAERHALIIIIALGESIVAIGVGSETGVDTGVVVAAVLGTGVAASLWWLYFDIVALVAERRLHNAAPGKERNEIARDSFSYLHFPMVAGIVLLALGLKTTLGHVDDPLDLVPATAMLGGTALYLAALVAFRWRNVHRFNVHRSVAAVLLCALIPLATAIASLAMLAILFAVLVALISYEYLRFREWRTDLRARLASDGGHD